MIQGKKIIAFTPVGRKRYMDVLAAYVKREHERGNIDEWIVFNNAYKLQDSTYCQQLRDNLGDWITIFNEAPSEQGDGRQFTWCRPEHISDFYKFMTQGEGVIYFRLDDDVVYIDDDCIPNLIRFRLEHPEPFLVFPTIVNNVRTSFHLQEQKLIPAWDIRNEMCDEVAWKHADYIHFLHLKALAAIEKGTLQQEFALKSEVFTDPTYEAGHISINSFAIFGEDMLKCLVSKDEESYLSVWRPKELHRQNARAGDSVLVHFAYHTQTEFMDSTGILNDYVKLAPALGFRTVRLAPDHVKRGASPVARHIGILPSHKPFVGRRHPMVTNPPRRGQKA